MLLLCWIIDCMCAEEIFSNLLSTSIFYVVFFDTLSWYVSSTLNYLVLVNPFTYEQKDFVIATMKAKLRLTDIRNTRIQTRLAQEVPLLTCVLDLF